MATRILLADDHAVVRSGFRLLLEGSPDIEVVAEAASGEDAYHQYFQCRPDIVLMDLSMPGMSGLEAMSRILAREPGARILALSAHEDTAHVKRALKIGAAGYLSKRTAPDELIEAIRQASEGKIYIEAGIAQQLAIQQLTGAANPVEVLSNREFEVFLHLGRGKSVAETADLLNLSPRTVGTHLYNIKQKLGASNAAEIALAAIRAGLIEP